MKRSGQRSPDVADAFVLTFADQGALASGAMSRWNSRKTIKTNSAWIT